jgi:hypothetical protein
MYNIQLSKMMPWFKTNGANLSGTNINVLVTQTLQPSQLDWWFPKCKRVKTQLKEPPK